MTQPRDKATEKIYRIRMYLLSLGAYANDLSFEQMMGYNRAERLLVRLQQSLWV